MIFIATNADASALNLGKISIKTINDVSQETYDVIAAYGNKSFTDDQIIAIDNFLIDLKNSGFYDKISHMILPVLSIAKENLDRDSNDYNKVFYDIKTKTVLNFKPSLPGKYGYYSIGSKGLYSNSGNNKQNVLKLSDNDIVNIEDFHTMTYVAQTDSTSDVIGVNLGYSMFIHKNNIRIGAQNNGHVFSVAAINRGMYLASYSSVNGYLAYSDKIYEYSGSTPGYYDSNGENPQTISLLSAPGFNTAGPNTIVSGFSIGRGLSKPEIDKLHNMIESLMSYLLVE